MAPVIGVLALQGDFREHQAALTDLAAQTRRVRSAEQLEGLDGLVIPGGESTTIGKLANDLGLLDRLRELTRSGLPVFGTCAGMILISDEVLDTLAGQPTFGGLDISIRRNAFGRQVASFEADIKMDQLDADPFPAVFIRAPWVERVGADVATLASVPDGSAEGRIVAVRQRSLLATAFHPELTSDRRIHAYFLDMVKGQV